MGFFAKMSGIEFTVQLEFESVDFWFVCLFLSYTWGIAQWSFLPVLGTGFEPGLAMSEHPFLLATWKTSFIGGSLSFMGLLPLYENFPSLKYLITISKYESHLF